MISALLYLQFQSTRNRMVARVKRLKKPKYLFGLLVGGVYFYFYFFRFLFRGGKQAGLAGGPAGTWAEWLQTLELVGALVLFALTASAWIFPRERAALAFTEAEVAFLFPAPIRRRTLIHFKLLRSQFAILFTTLIMFLLTNRWGHGGNGWIRFAGWWLIFSTLNLHFLAASFTRTRLLDLGISVWWRRGVALVVLAVVAGVSIWWAGQSGPPPRAEEFGDAKAWSAYAQRVLDSGPLHYVLLPFRFIVRPYLAQNGAAFLLALWPVALLLALHYVWVIRSNVAFEEASVELARKRAEILSAARQGRAGVAKPRRKRDPFRLRSTGSPSVALLWKNLIAMGSAFSARIWIVLGAVVGIWAFMFAKNQKHADLLNLVGMLMLMSLFLTVMIGPQIVRQDFRRDLRAVDVLKLYPLPGWRLVLGELLAPAVVLTGIQWLLLWIATLIFVRDPNGGVIALSARLSIASAVAMVLPMLNLISLLIPNAAVLLFPAWFQSAQDGLQGIEATGQRLIFALGQFLVFLFALIPAGVMFVAVFLAARLVLPWTLGVPLAGLAAALALAARSSRRYRRARKSLRTIRRGRGATDVRSFR